MKARSSSFPRRPARGGEGQIDAGPSRKNVLAVASGGGHWSQLMRLMPAFEGFPVVFVTVEGADREWVPDHPIWIVRDATRWDRFGVAVLALQILRVVLRERPAVVVTTGAAPGCLAVIIGKLLCAKTIWLDSIANCERISLSGRIARRFSDLYLTQWEHLAGEKGSEYAGRVF